MELDNARYRPTSLLWIILIISGCLVFVLNIMQLQTYTINTTFLSPPRAKFDSLIDGTSLLKGYFIKTPGCTIPEMDPMDSSIKEYIFEEEPIDCNDGIPPLFDSNLTSIYIIEASYSQYNISETSLLNCCYQPFYRRTPHNNNKDNKVDFDKSCYEFSDSVDISYEFIRVTCKYKETQIYKDFFAFVPFKNKTTNNPNKKLNVLMLGIDAVSKLNLYRQMPKTVKYLNELQTFEMLGYNKVGDNTFPNLIPVLTGLTEEELTKECWPNSDSYFDNCSFIWNDFQNAEYSTAFGEDSAWMGLFYYTRNGFHMQPTDYFWDHFDLEAERQIGNHHSMNVDQCIGPRSVHKVLNDYITKFTTVKHLQDDPYFAFFWSSSFSHDFLNKPKLGDEDYVTLLKYLNETGTLNNTALIFLSDHGIRWGDIRSTYQGRMEERLPFLYIGLPDWYTNQHPLLRQNLKSNIRRLTTPFDLHETLNDLLQFDKLTSEFLNHRKINNSNITSQRGFSLFDQIPDTRTCDDAGISSHWCTCQTSQPVNVSDPIVKEAANYTINEINEKLVGYADCATLELDDIIDARVHKNTEEMMTKSHFSQDYTLTLKTEPGGALFETTIRKYVKHNKNYYFKLTGTISRINLYGEQSKCITDFHLKLYCYCREYKLI